MKRFLLLSTTILVLLVDINPVQAQDSRVITTALPFLRIAGDARAGGMADMGVATSPDVWSQQWNPAKYSFIDREYQAGIAYTPYLGQLVNDIGIGQIAFANKFNEQSAFAGSIRYFGLGTIFITEDGETGTEESPNEFVIDGTYSLKLSEQFSMAVTGRFLRSDLRIQSQSNDASAASSFSVGVAGYYQSEEIPYNDFSGRWRGGFNISNIGPKISYDTGGQENFLPTNLGLGGGFDFILDDGFSKIGVTAELNKLLVPTPPIRDLQDQDEDGDRQEILQGQDDDVDFFSGIFQSFGDAPGGSSEELKEITWALGAEYTYDDTFALRTGYFNESDEKGGRQFLTLGAGFKFSEIVLDLSYLFSTSAVQSPLEGTLRFGLTFNFGDEYVQY
ncbi:type IX secretion system outer membrane channel protein PorV [Nonlabens ponticola]|uniref:Type IX secretion system outer membrane channel protein PorV n=1 Tax=Nonlabens ponticola TaxID=2496866 RepID=A0A3S9MWL6_9FLAO|nr:type IX secretion system outer membrane channel protein PorV [Nonlabens ponticola]AZQ43626.1 type IX secretion system outer membrane channel protein PorV [Nonlabens ponticola]